MPSPYDVRHSGQVIVTILPGEFTPLVGRLRLSHFYLSASSDWGAQTIALAVFGDTGGSVKGLTVKGSANWLCLNYIYSIRIGPPVPGFYPFMPIRSVAGID